MLSHDPINGPVWCVAFSVAGVEERLFVGHGVLSKPGLVGVVRLLDAIIAPDPDQCQPPAR